MGLTGEEESWLCCTQMIHKLFCSCDDALGHLTKCLLTRTEEDAEYAAAMAVFDLGDITGENGDGGDPPTGEDSTG
ncbi:ORF2 [torque teno Delphinidae virus 2]